ncbi:four-carbon acid sugar kinase family protein [Cedecea davisae]|uniref:four-carbon acid sugar kinase family protein n=1 Tax=Cedecea davisae TaxID=158484 RepID=UPI00376EF5A0
MKVAIIADDLTGANATAALLSARGFTTMTCLDTHDEKEAHFDVISFSTDSRSVAAAEAYRRVAERIAGINPEHTLISKRIDSTLRGNMGAEVDAVIDSFPHLMAVVVPVYPSSGRICVGGSLLVDGIPLQNTAMRNDPKNPMVESSVVELFRQQTNKNVGYICLRDVLSGENNLSKKLRELYRNNVRIVVIDATTGDDILQIALAVQKAKLPCFCVDPGVFTAQLAWIRFSAGQRRTNKILLAIGSVSDLTQRQIKKLRYEREVYIETLSPERLIDISLLPESAAPLVESLIDKTRNFDVVGIDSVEAPEHICSLDRLARKYEVDNHEVSCMINRGMAEVVAQVLIKEKSPISGLYGSGGDVMVSITKRLKGRGVVLKDEVEPLTVYGKLVGGLSDGLPLITKGGFVGNDDTLIHCVDYLVTKVSGKTEVTEAV